MRRALYVLARSEVFETGVALLLLAHAVVLATEHYQQPRLFADVGYMVNVAVLSALLVELLARLVGVGPRHFVRSGWNLLAALVVLLSLLGTPRIH